VEGAQDCRVISFRWLAVALGIAGLIQSPIAAWDGGGHELIATMAFDRLNAKAQAAVAAMAKELQGPGGRPYDAITMACWMDDLRERAPALPYHGLFLSWHYIDIGLDSNDARPSFEPGDDNEIHGNVVQGLKRALVVLQGGTDPYVKTKAMACAMIMHLVGDIHQPLHASTKYFRAYGGWRNDAGGNKEDVDNGPPGEKRLNLHAFWDSAWRASFDSGGNVVLDPNFAEQKAHDAGKVQGLASELEKQAPSGDIDLEPHFERWAWESNDIARNFVYREITATSSPKYCRLSSGYVAKANTMARQRLVLAAYRLAVLLNETLGSDQTITPPSSYPAGPSSEGQAY
jgi:hypothetical protein